MRGLVNIFESIRKADVLMDPEERAKNIREGTIFRGGGLVSLDNSKMLEITKLEFD